MKDFQGAITDYGQAVRLNPNYALAYYNRGANRERSGDLQGEAYDYQRAANLAKAQGDRQAYEVAIDNLKTLRR